jgi:outer membrane protein OmpA-like peptidoglycan-associated protein
MALRPDAKLILEAHTDVRGGAAYNQRLSERRAERVKAYLVSQGIPADRIETKGYGKSKNLTRQEVESLTAENPDVTPQARQKMKYNIVIFLWANNRRVDIMLSPVGKASKRYYPFNAADVDVLLGRGSAVKQSATKK